MTQSISSQLLERTNFTAARGPSFPFVKLNADHLGPRSATLGQLSPQHRFHKQSADDPAHRQIARRSVIGGLKARLYLHDDPPLSTFAATHGDCPRRYRIRAVDFQSRVGILVGIPKTIIRFKTTAGSL